MISFECDYLEGCHEAILKAFAETNMEQQPGYGADRFTESAKQKIRKACGAENADVYFLNGGTQTNQLIIDAVLQPYEGVLAAESGHVNVHEAGAIEYTGHKVLTLPSHDGKVTASDVRAYVETYYADANYEHMVFPGMLYISHPTEYGTLYTKQELTELSAVCREKKITLFMDGARLGYGLAAKDTDVTLPLIAELCDVFYIGGTKVGALNGEAVVFPRNNAPSHFLTRIKQHGALFAKGRLVGIQFDTLFTDDLYLTISRHAIETAEQVKDIFVKAGYPMFIDSPTNQQFVIMENKTIEEIGRRVRYGFWEKYDDDHTVIRFATSWATKQENVNALREIVADLQKHENSGDVFSVGDSASLR